MSETPSEILEKFNVFQIADAKEKAKTAQRVETLEKENTLVWTAIDKGRDAVTSVREQFSLLRIQIAGISGVISIVQTIVVAWIIYKTTKGG